MQIGSLPAVSGFSTTGQIRVVLLQSGQLVHAPVSGLGLALSADLGDLAAKDKASLATDVTGTLPLANGGLGATTASGGRDTLELGALATKDQAALASDVSGTLPIANGGTGATSQSGARTGLGLGALAIKDQASLAADVSGILPITSGGTGATTASAALAALGGQASESGSWLPIIGALGSGAVDGTHTYLSQVGTYFKIGPLVLIEGYVQLSAKDSSMAGSFVVIRGLPFASMVLTNARWSGVVTNFGGISSLSSPQNVLGLQIQSNASFAFIPKSGSAYVAPADIGNSSYLGFSIIYMAAS